MRNTFLTVLFTFAILVADAAQPREVSGTIYLDANGNGLRDCDERGLEGIRVSNGDTIVVSGPGGRFTIGTLAGQSVFPILTSGYAISGSGVVNSNFHYITGEDSPGEISFPLREVPFADSFTIAAVGDIQVGSPAEMAYASRTVFSELAARTDIAFALMAGDMVNDNPQLLPEFKRHLELLPYPVWTAAGNHDKGRNSTDFGPYHLIFGAADYAFEYGRVHFIVLNNVHYAEKGKYTGRISERQQRFLTNILATVPRQETVVICQHIPMKHTDNADRVLEILGARDNVLILSGHTHTVEKHLLAEGVCEQVIGAPSGSWWTGERGPDAVPVALQRCGSPRNYFTVDFTDGLYRLHYKGVGLDGSVQGGIWFPGEEPADSDNPYLAGMAADSFIVNIFAAGPDAIVTATVDGLPPVRLQHTPMRAPWAARIEYWNETAGYPTAYGRRIPLRGTPSPHIWTGTLPEGLEKGTHRMTVRANDPHGMEVTLTRIFTTK